MSPRIYGALGGALGGGAFIAFALAIATPTVERWEGMRLAPYRDIVGIWTVCSGETRVTMRRYTPAECEHMLRQTLESDFAPAVLAAVPALAQRPLSICGGDIAELQYRRRGLCALDRRAALQ